MEESKKRRKQRKAELTFWANAVERSIKEVRQEIGLRADSRIPDAVLVEEVLGLGDPDAVPGVDAVVPGGDVVAAKSWIRARLCGLADTDTARLELARKIAPLPDHEPAAALWGMNRKILQRAITYDANNRRRPQDK